MEFTVALGRTRRVLTVELNKKGIGRGFTTANDEDWAGLNASIQKPSQMYSTAQALDKVEKSIRARISAKNEARFSGFDLVIEAPLFLLPLERLESLRVVTEPIASTLPFREVHVIGDRAPGIGFRLK